MTESKKTTTVSFRIEDNLKEKLLSIAKQENKTITNKARELLTESLNLSPRKTLTGNLRKDISHIDQELQASLSKWHREVDRQLSTFSAGQSLMNDFSDGYQRLRQELDAETTRHKETQQKMTRWTIIFFLTVLLSNALIITLLLFFR